MAAISGTSGKLNDIRLSLVKFERSALNSIVYNLWSDSMIHSSDEFKESKPKLFHTYGTTAKVVFTP